MTKEQQKKLDKLYQGILLSKYNNRSILGGEATLIHHFLPKSSGLSLRWYLPNGVPLNIEQHNIIHSSDPQAKVYIDYIINLKGKSWVENLKKQRSKICKYLRYDEVMRHISMIDDNYC